ncbi:ABC transporter permease [Deltaproteobacteria bacterium]|nr:ABC transporter permease [Deltaproteobacteria bacterium]
MTRWFPGIRMEVIAALLRVSIREAIQYRASFVAEIVVGALSAAGIAAPLFLVYARVPHVAGWTLDEALLVTGFFLLYNGFVSGLVEPNLGAIVDGVRTGALDYLLVRPVDVQWTISFRKIAPSAIWDVLAGVAVIGGALWRLGPPAPLASVVAFGMLTAGIVATYGLWLLVVCTSFWFVRVDNLRFLLGAVTDAGRWPVSVYGRGVRIALTTVIPVALVSSYPAMALLERLDGSLAFGAVATAVVSLVGSRAVLLFALRRYSSASS